MKLQVPLSACNLATLLAPAESTDNTIFFDDTPDTPIFFNHPKQDFSNDQSVVTVNEGGTASHQPFQDSAVLSSVSIGAGTSLHGRFCKMSRAMAESVSQREFYGRDKMHYMASQAICEHDHEHLHNSHLDEQERMHHPIVFLAEIMGDIMYLDQVLRQPDPGEFIEAVVKEINFHIDNDHLKQKTLRFCPQYGQCSASKILRQGLSQSTRPGSIFTVS
jgi:hypothetical protein